MRAVFAKKALALALAAVAALLLRVPPMIVNANAPAPPSYFYVLVQNPPGTARYADILVKLDPQSEAYAEFNEDNGRKTGITAESEIAKYDEDGYMSLAFHYGGVNANMQIGTALTFIMNSSNLSVDKVTSLLKVAVIDGEGNILHISDAIDVTPPQNKYTVRLDYDAADGRAEAQYSDYYTGGLIRPGCFGGASA
ncbi:MAG: hypothetical protein LBI44_08415 [Oscillospiraceae bacterium]|nr:hypothetical protein [Oscillospiraceae bacterium]